MTAPVSWLAIDEGWVVVDPKGAAIGEVARVIGDANVDIFDGLRLRTAQGEERYVPADRVSRIVEGRVALDADLAELELAPADAEPGGAELRRDRGAEL